MTPICRCVFAGGTALILSLTFPALGSLADDSSSKEKTPERNSTTRSMVFRGQCIDAASGQPVVGAIARFYPTMQHSQRNVLSVISKTDEQGRFIIEFDWDDRRSGETIDYARSRIVVTAEGFGSQVILCGDTKVERVINLERSRTIRGRVVDKRGQGIRDVIVRVGRHASSGLFDARTDTNGDYVIDDVQRSKGELAVTASHAAFGHREKVIEEDSDRLDFKIDAEVGDHRGTKITVVSQYGKHKMVGGVEMDITGRIYHGADVQTTATLRWNRTDSRPALKYDVQVASDAFGNRETWVVAWAQDRAQIWVANSMGKDPWIRAIDFSDPGSIVQFYAGRWAGQASDKDLESAEVDAARLRSLLGDDFGDGTMPPEIMLAMSRVFPALRTEKAKAKTFQPSQISAAEFDPKWVITGTVRDNGGRPISGVMVEIRHHDRAGSKVGGLWLHRSQTDKNGVYKLEFPTTLSHSIEDGLEVAPIFAGHFEKRFAQHGKLRLNPFSSVAKTPAEAVIGTEHTVDFQLLPAAELKAMLPEEMTSLVSDGTARLTWDSGESESESYSRVAAISKDGEIRLTEIPVGVDATIELLSSPGIREFQFPVRFEQPGRHTLRVGNTEDAGENAFSIHPESPPVQVTIVRNQKTLPPPKDETAFGDLVQEWTESCQGNNTLAIKNHNPKVWQDVVAGYNVVHVVYDPPRSMSVHTDDGFVKKLIREVAFPLYEMQPGSIFAIVEGQPPTEETLVLESQLIEPTIKVTSHDALADFVSSWYQLRIDAWNNELPKEGDETKLATIDVAPGGILSLDGNPLPKDIHQLGGELGKAGYHRDTTCVLVRGEPKTSYKDLHWPIWKLWSMRWKNVVLRVAE